MDMQQLMEKMMAALAATVATEVLNEVDHVLGKTGWEQSVVEKMDEQGGFAAIKASAAQTPECQELLAKIEALMADVNQKHKDIVHNERQPQLAAIRAKFVGAAQ